MITLVEILRLHLRDEQLGEDVDLHDIASKTNHYSSSDLKGEFLYSNSLTNQVSALRISCNGIRQRFLWQLQLDFAYTQWCRRNSWSSIRRSSIGIPYSNYYVEQLWTCNDWSPLAGSHSELRRWHDQFSRKKTLDKHGDVKLQIDGHSEKRTYSLKCWRIVSLWQY